MGGEGMGRIGQSPYRIELSSWPVPLRNVRDGLLATGCMSICARGKVLLHAPPEPNGGESYAPAAISVTIMMQACLWIA